MNKKKIYIFLLLLIVFTSSLIAEINLLGVSSFGGFYFPIDHRLNSHYKLQDQGHVFRIEILMRNNNNWGTKYINETIRIAGLEPPPYYGIEYYSFNESIVCISKTFLSQKSTRISFSFGPGFFTEKTKDKVGINLYSDVQFEFLTDKFPMIIPAVTLGINYGLIGSITDPEMRLNGVSIILGCLFCPIK